VNNRIGKMRSLSEQSCFAQGTDHRLHPQLLDLLCLLLRAYQPKYLMTQFNQPLRDRTADVPGCPCEKEFHCLDPPPPI
jgi:hypothetical protein